MIIFLQPAYKRSATYVSTTKDILNEISDRQSCKFLHNVSCFMTGWSFTEVKVEVLMNKCTKFQCSVHPLTIYECLKKIKTREGFKNQL